MSQRILVVEDDRSIADMVVKNLDAAGYECRPCYDGGHALAEFERWTPDLVVLDLGLPGLDGLQVARRIRRDRDTPILMADRALDRERQAPRPRDRRRRLHHE